MTFKNIANVKEFVPKRKVVKTEEQFPNLIAVCSEKKKVKNAKQTSAYRLTSNCTFDNRLRRNSFATRKATRTQKNTAVPAKVALLE